MEEGTKAKKTIFIGGIREDVDETVLYEHFSTFGDSMHLAPGCRHPQLGHQAILSRFNYQRLQQIREQASFRIPTGGTPLADTHTITEPKHRGFAFITYGSSADAQDAIDNMDLNELLGRVIKAILARPSKGPVQPNNRASGSIRPVPLLVC
jgi:peptidyl-prolyl isomerase E (cyclophilin E)